MSSGGFAMICGASKMVCGTMLAEQKLKAGQKENGARQSARSSASTYIRMRVHGRIALYILLFKFFALSTKTPKDPSCYKESEDRERALDPGWVVLCRGRHAWRKNPGFPAGVATMDTSEST